MIKKCLFGLIGLTLLGGNFLRGQTPIGDSNGPSGVPVAAPVQAAGPDCTACSPTKTTCVPENYVKKTTKVVYSSGSEPLCVGYFRGLFGHCSCEAGRCEHPYTRRYLIKKIQTCEENAIKCVPAEVPTCEQRR